MQKIIAAAGKFSRLEISLDFRQTLVLENKGKSPTGLTAIALCFLEITDKGTFSGPEMLFEIGDLAWYPYQYREAGQLFAECIYRIDEKGRLLVNHRRKRQLIHLAEAWDRELLQLDLFLKKSS